MMLGDGEKDRRWCEGRRDKEEDEKIRVSKLVSGVNAATTGAKSLVC